MRIITYAQSAHHNNNHDKNNDNNDNNNNNKLPTKSLGFGGFDSSRLLMLRGGNSHVRRM